MAGPIIPGDFVDYLDDASRAHMPPGLGGTPVNQLCIELLKRGHHLTIFTLDKTVESEIILEGSQLRICIGPYRRRPRDRALDIFRTERHYIEYAIRREWPDIVHAHWTYEFAMGAKAAGRPIVVTAHDAPINVLRAGFDIYRIIRTGMAYTALRGVRHLAAVSPHVADHLRCWQFYKGPTTVIPNGLPQTNFDYFEPARAAQKHRRGHPPVFATVLNGWAGLKNGPAALRAFSIVRKTHPESRLLMFGSGHGPHEAAPQWARKLELDANVDFVGLLPYSDLLRRLCEEVDILVHPAREEAHSMTIIESMAMGISVIGGEHSGGVPWTLAGGMAGRLVNIENPASIAQAMLELADVETREALAQAGRDFVLNRFRIDAVANAYLHLYNNVLQAS